MSLKYCGSIGRSLTSCCHLILMLQGLQTIWLKSFYCERTESFGFNCANNNKKEKEKNTSKTHDVFGKHSNVQFQGLINHSIIFKFLMSSVTEVQSLLLIIVREWKFTSQWFNKLFICCLVCNAKKTFDFYEKIILVRRG